MNVRVNIAGAFAKKNELKMFIFKNKPLFRNMDVTVYDGINNCPWNGGRINRDIYYDDDTINFYYRNNISIALTFTNPVIDIDNVIGNELLEKFHSDGNVIISANDELREYIKERYPSYKHTRSITSFGKISVPMSDDDLSKYKELERHYDYIVPRCEHIFDERFKELNQSKYEIMLNDTCVYNCPFYGEHFEAIAEQNRLFNKPWKEGGHEAMYKVEECWLSDRSDFKKPDSFNPDSGQQNVIDKLGDTYGMDLKSTQIKLLLDRGVYNFKITGREMTEEDFIEELKLYITDESNLR